MEVCVCVGALQWMMGSCLDNVAVSSVMCFLKGTTKALPYKQLKKDQSKKCVHTVTHFLECQLVTMMKLLCIFSLQM